MVVHNGTDAFITAYNDVHTGNDPLISLTADLKRISLVPVGLNTLFESFKFMFIFKINLAIKVFILPRLIII